MKTFAIAALLGFVSAERVHDFFAERNFICKLCETIVEHAAKDELDLIDNWFQTFPKIEEKISEFQGRFDLVDLNDPRKTCTNIELCAIEDVSRILYEEMPLDLSMHIKTVNGNPNSTWVAGANPRFEGASYKDVSKMMGTVVDPDWTYKAHVKGDTANLDLPTNYDIREAHPECNDVVDYVRDQANCGSCWAFGTTEAFNDRLCLVEGFHEHLSTADTAGCCGFAKCMSMDCNGGQVGTPWSWFDNTGVVTGGMQGENKGCYDYTMPECAHHVASTTMPNCEDVTQVSPQCLSSCPTGTDISYSSDKHKAQTSYNVRGVDNIKSEIYNHGSVTAAFTVYEDFLTYTSGVYQHTTGQQLGGHAIKVIGYGTEGGQDYWLCVNSWNNTWGDKGTFKILQGDCGMDDQMHAGLVPSQQ